MQIEPQKEHEWLQKFVGEWGYETEAKMSPDQPPVKSQGTESVRPLGGLWIIAEGHGDMPGCGPATTIMTLGFDPQRKRYLGTWVGSMMTHMWVYDGALDITGRVLTLDTEGPGMDGDGKTAKYKDVVEFKNDDYRILASEVLRADGKWQRFNTVHYRRKP